MSWSWKNASTSATASGSVRYRIPETRPMMFEDAKRSCIASQCSAMNRQTFGPWRRFVVERASTYGASWVRISSVMLAARTRSISASPGKRDVAKRYRSSSCGVVAEWYRCQ